MAPAPPTNETRRRRLAGPVLPSAGALAPTAAAAPPSARARRSRRARAEPDETIENLARGQRISVIEQAAAPSRPTSPDRPIIAAGGVALGLGAGLGIVVLLELLNSAIRRPADLQTKLGITPFGTLPLIRTPGQIRRRRAVLVLAFLCVAAGVPASLWYIQTEVMPLDMLLDRVLDQVGIASLSLRPPALV